MATPTGISGGPRAPANPRRGACTAVIGMQWGDEGKGKIADLLAADHDAVVRFNGGSNAGHSVVIRGERYKLHQVPTGVLTPGKTTVIANGVVVDPDGLIAEIDGLVAKGVDVSGLAISDRAHVVLPYHRAEDAMREEMLGSDGAGISPIGTTRRGIGPCYADKVQRATAVRVGDLLRPGVLRAKIAAACALKAPVLRAMGGSVADEAVDVEAVFERARIAGERLRPMVGDTTALLHQRILDGGRVLFEGANGTLLDVDHGTYPFVTGSTCVSGGIGSGAGVPPMWLDRVVGIVKAYSTRVGAGPLPTELVDAAGDRIRERGREYGTTTGRPRRVGWFDAVAARYGAMLNGTTEIALMLLDVLAGFDEIRVCTAYRMPAGETRDFIPDGEVLARAMPVYRTVPGFGDEIGSARRASDLPAPARQYIALIEELVGVRASYVSVGPDREQTIVM